MRRKLSALVISVVGILCGIGLPSLPTARGETAGAPAPGARAPRAEAGATARNPKVAAKPREAIKVAISVDDMPGGGFEVRGYTHTQMVKDLISALRAHRVPEAGGFIVGGMLEGHAERAQALEAWVQAGFVVGSHSYTHPRIADLGVERYSDDILKNRNLVDRLEQRTRQEQSYFRFPYLEEGLTREDRRALWQLLQRERYTVARASIAFGDTDWADAYLRCQQTNEADSLLALDRSYVSQAVAFLQWSVEAADDVLGRAIPHVLLLHVNVPAAKNLDTLLRLYEEAGVQFISIEEALRDPAYSVFYDVRGGDLLTQASAALGRPHPPKPLALDGLIERLCR
jgi:peptidoglycan-N-acetylglucosamine deacetylase